MPGLFHKKPEYRYNFHDDKSLADKTPEPGAWYSNLTGDAAAILKLSKTALSKGFSLGAKEALPDLDINDPLSRAISKELVSQLWGSMLHPPLSYRGNKFQYRTADGSYNNILYPDLGKAGLPYAKTVQGEYAQPGARPDPGDLFDLLMARNETSSESQSGISMMLLYHATTIIHDIFRTDDDDSNKSATSSYLDLAPLYGNDQANQDSVRQHKNGLLKPDTFAEKRLLNQPPGVCIYLIMYNRFHNYVAEQLLTLNENGRFSLPANLFPAGVSLDSPEGQKILATDAGIAALKKQDEDLFQTARLITCGMYIQIAIHDYLRCLMLMHGKDTPWTLDPRVALPERNNKRGLQRGEGNMVSVEFNLLYRFHSPISKRDAEWTSAAFQTLMRVQGKSVENPTEEQYKQGIRSPEQIAEGDIPVPVFKQVLDSLKGTKQDQQKFLDDRTAKPCWPPGLDLVGARGRDDYRFKRDPVTHKFDDAQLAAEMIRAIEDPIMHFGAQNVPKALKAVEVLGILQARQWEVASLNEFREFFGLSKHKSFEDINTNPEIQNHLRDLYEDPDMVELYPGLMCEGDGQVLDPGTSCPNQEGTALWRCVFSDAVTLVRSDRFYTLDWNVGSLTGWGMKELTSDPKINKGSVMHRLFQRAFPGYFTYNSLHMWQPFYTPSMNAVLAQEQGYINFLDLRELEIVTGKAEQIKDLDRKKNTNFKDLILPANKDSACRLRRKLDPKGDTRWRGGEYARRMAQPVQVSDYKKAKEVIAAGDHTTWVNPHIEEVSDIPAGALREVLTRRWGKWKQAEGIVHDTLQKGWQQVFMDYFVDMSQTIRLREQRSFQKRGDTQIYQIDIVKDYGIPILTRFIADLLGFWDLVKTPEFIDRKYDENEIYQYIVNCHNFESYDSDQTKGWQRRIAFKKSMEQLKTLTEYGVGKSESTFFERGILGFHTERIYGYTGDSDAVKNARRIAVSLVQALRNEFTLDEVVAVMVATALNAAQQIMQTFTESLAYFIDPKTRDDGKLCGPKKDSQTKLWDDLQGFAWTDAKISAGGKTVYSKNSAEDQKIWKYVLEASRFNQSSNLARMYKGGDATIVTADVNNQSAEVEVTNGKTVVFNLYKAYSSVLEKPDVFDATRPESFYLIYGVALDKNQKPINPKFSRELARVALTGMMKHVAHLKNLRVAHDKLGRLKRVQTPEGLTKYANIQWDLLLSYPTSWSLRFDGVGRGVFTEGDNADQGHGMNQIWHTDNEITYTSTSDSKTETTVTADGTQRTTQSSEQYIYTSKHSYGTRNSTTVQSREVWGDHSD